MKRMNGVVVLLVSTGVIFAQGGRGPGTVVVPDSSKEAPEDIGIWAHTNHLVLVHPAFTGTAPAGETPQSIRPVYNLPSIGGQNVIVILDAFDYATAQNDLCLFSAPCCFASCTTAHSF